MSNKDNYSKVRLGDIVEIKPGGIFGVITEVADYNPASNNPVKYSMTTIKGRPGISQSAWFYDEDFTVIKKSPLHDFEIIAPDNKIYIMMKYEDDIFKKIVFVCLSKKQANRFVIDSNDDIRCEEHNIELFRADTYQDYYEANKEHFESLGIKPPEGRHS